MWIGWKCTRERPCRLGCWQSNEDSSLFKELVAEGCPGTSGGEKELSPVGIGSFSIPVLNWEDGASWNNQNWYHTGSIGLGP